MYLFFTMGSIFFQNLSTGLIYFCFYKHNLKLILSQKNNTETINNN